MGAEGIEADVEAGGGEFGAGTGVRNVMELIEKIVLQGGGNSFRDVHTALRCDASEIHDNNFTSVR